jgi:hypothetical protein
MKRRSFFSGGTGLRGTVVNRGDFFWDNMGGNFNNSKSKFIFLNKKISLKRIALQQNLIQL